MSITSDDVERLLVEIATKKPPPVADTPELTDLRARLQDECDEIIANGGIIDVPHEIPGGINTED